MPDKYVRTKRYWNAVFRSGKAYEVKTVSLDNPELDRAMVSFCTGTHSVLDFGCGGGSMLFKCHMRGTEKHVGIDASEEAIALARDTVKKNKFNDFDFRQGSVDTLLSLENSSFDGAILSNIADNLMPEDSEVLLAEIHRLVRAGGKIFFKINPFLTDEQIKIWKIKKPPFSKIPNFYKEPSGLLLWNLTTDVWERKLGEYFKITEYIDVYYPDEDIHNRLFILINK